jgi:hypothetical protein
MTLRALCEKSQVFGFRGEYGQPLQAINSITEKGDLLVEPLFGSATPSNCGKILKPQLPSDGGKLQRGQGNDPGYGKNVGDENNGQSAAKS